MREKQTNRESQKIPVVVCVCVCVCVCVRACLRACVRALVLERDYSNMTIERQTQREKHYENKPIQIY